MAAFPKEITIDVIASLTISDETANRCLRILEMWQDDHPDCDIIGNRENGRTRFSIRKKGELDAEEQGE